MARAACGPRGSGAALYLLLLALSRTPATATATVLGALGEVKCTDEVTNAVLNKPGTEVQRLVVADAVVDCTSFSRGLLMLALEFKREEASLHLATAYSPRSWQLFARNVTNATVLLMAADLGYTAVVEELVSNKGMDPMQTEVGGNTAFHLASQWPATGVKLLELSSDPAALQLAMNDAGDQAMHVALKNNLFASAKQMLESALIRIGPAHAKKVATTVNGAGQQPVHLTGNDELLVLLVRRGAVLDSLNGDGALPYHTASYYAGAASNGALARVAAAAGAAGFGPNVRDSLGRTPLHYAAMGGVLENIQWLIGQGADSGLLDNSGRLALSLGLANGHTHIVDAFSLGRSPPLIAVISMGSIEMLRFMVNNRSVPVTTLDPITGRGAVFKAAEAGQNEMVDFMLSRGADVNSLDKSGLSLLAATVLAGRPSTLELLLNRSANVAQVLQNGSSALHLAASLGAASEAGLLLASGASVNAVDYYGQTPMHLVASVDVADQLLLYGAKPVSTTRGLQPLHSAALAGRTEVMESILRWRHGGVDAQATNGDTPLHLAAASGVSSAVVLLVRWCADSQARNAAGRLPHQLAFNATVARLIRDSTMQTDRCQCDCGPYDADPRFLTYDWRGGCAATVRCQLDSYSGATEQLRCSPQSGLQDGAEVNSTWTPTRPTLSCTVAAAVSSARSRAGKVQAALLLLPLLLGLLPTPDGTWGTFFGLRR